MKRNKGFTLVELIVVIAIIAILISIIVPNYKGYIQKAKEKKVLVVAEEMSYTLANLCYNNQIDKEVVESTIEQNVLGGNKVNVTSFTDNQLDKKLTINFNYKNKEYVLNFNYATYNYNLKYNSKIIFNIEE